MGGLRGEAAGVKSPATESSAALRNLRAASICCRSERPVDAELCVLSLEGLPAELPSLPVETIRDLLGIRRTLYLPWTEDGASSAGRKKT